MQTSCLFSFFRQGECPAARKREAFTSGYCGDEEMRSVFKRVLRDEETRSVYERVLRDEETRSVYERVLRIAANAKGIRK